MICTPSSFERLLEIGGECMEWSKIMLYVNAMSVFVPIFVTGEISEKDIIEIEEKVCQKSGINPLSVFRYSKLDFKELKKKG